MDWAVTVDLDVGEVDAEDAAGELLDLLLEHEPGRDPAVSGADGRLGVTLTAWGDSYADALPGTVAVVEELTGEVAAGAVVVGVHVRSYEELDREGDAYQVPPLAGTAEVARELGVSRTRVRSILSTLERFPRPLAQLAAGPVWDLFAVRAFAEQWERRPGRPAKVATG